jgi:hypothetical protein
MRQRSSASRTTRRENPPTAGPRPGARLWTMVSKAMREAACPAAALSRTIARPSTNPPQPPTACPMPAGDCARHDIETKGDEQGRPPPELVGDRAVKQLAAGNAEQIERDRQLYRAARDPEIGGGEWQYRHQDVHRQSARCDHRHQHPERRLPTSRSDRCPYPAEISDPIIPHSPPTLDALLLQQQAACQGRMQGSSACLAYGIIDTFSDRVGERRDKTCLSPRPPASEIELPRNSSFVLGF